MICRYGCIESLHSDNESHFANNIIRCLTEMLRILHHFSTLYYPQRNERVERVVGTLRTMLKHTVAAAAAAAAPLADGLKLADIKVYGLDINLDEVVLSVIMEAQEKRDSVQREVDEGKLTGVDGLVRKDMVYWVPLLHTVLWVYRSTPHSVTGLSPALLALCRELKLLMDIVNDDPVHITDEDHKACIAKRMGWVMEAVLVLTEIQSGGDTAAAAIATKFQLGQWVWKHESKYDGNSFVPVFAPRWMGPFMVHSVYRGGTYKLQTVPAEGKSTGYLKNPVNSSRLKAYWEGKA